MIGGWELIVILLITLVLFGGKKLPQLARNLGLGVHEFKKGMQGIKNDDPKSDDHDKVE